MVSSRFFTATAFTFLKKRSIIGDMKIEEIKKGIKNIKEPRRTGYGNFRHKLEDIIIIGYGGVRQKSSGISGEIS